MGANVVLKEDNVNTWDDDVMLMLIEMSIYTVYVFVII
jgi:hypothetical protein